MSYIYLRELSKKHVLFNWGQNESDEFQTIKNLLKSMWVLSQFDPDKPCIVYTDASYTSGFRYLLCQEKYSGSISLIQCGSTGISSSQQNYSCYELKIMDLSFESKKAAHYLLGSKFSLQYKTDHSAL